MGKKTQKDTAGLEKSGREQKICIRRAWRQDLLYEGILQSDV